MTVPDQDPEALAARLGTCLGRIDAALADLLDGTAVDPDDTADALHARADELHELVDAVLAGERYVRDGDAAAPVDRVVAEQVEHLLAAASFPLVVHTELPQQLPPVACSRAELAGAVQRALALAAAHAGNGGDIAVRAWPDRATVVLAIDAECDGAPRVQQPGARALTLQAFLAECRGRCDVDGDGQRFGLRLLLPQAQRTQPH